MVLEFKGTLDWKTLNLATWRWFLLIDWRTHLGQGTVKNLGPILAYLAGAATIYARGNLR
jgi:hypothetical protein